MTVSSGRADLTGMVICNNEAARIADCLASLDFCADIVVIDSGSTDGTLDIVRGGRARLFERPFVSWNDQKDFGRSLARCEWVLNIDADEIVSGPLRDQIVSVLTEGPDDGVAAYRFPFRNHFRDRWVRGCGYHPDHHVRLVRRDRAHWDRQSVHDRVVTDGSVRTLDGHIDHFSFESIDDFIGKSSGYADAFARHAHGIGKRCGPLTIAAKTAFRFFRAYVLQRGFTEGTLGLLIAGLQAYEVFQKYTRLWELSQFSPPEAGPGTADGAD